jgi:HK97 family phage major capsid protein
VEYRDAAYQFLRQGRDGLNSEQRATLQIDSNIGGGYLRPPESFINRLIVALDNAITLRDLCTVFSGLKYGDSLGAVSLEGDISSFEWGSGELTSAEIDSGIEFGKRELEPKSLKRKIVKISEALLGNSRMDIEGIVIQRVAKALRETLETAYMTGSGEQQPLGLFVDSNNGIPTSRNFELNSATGPDDEDLMEMQDSLDDPYQPNARWLFHRDFATKVRKLKSGDGQYLWQPGLQSGIPNQILGKPYTTSAFAPNTFKASQNVVIYGDFSWYWIAEAHADMEIQRLIEKYAEDGLVGLLFKKISADAMPVLSNAFIRGKTKSA